MRGARFERRRVLAARARGEPDAPVRVGERGVEIGGLDAALDHDIAGVSWTRGASGASASRASTTAGNSAISTSTRSAMSSASAALARPDRGDRLADKAHDVFRQDRLLDRLIIEFVQHRPDRPHAVEVRGANDVGAVRRGDAHDAAGRDRTADETHPMRGGKIGGEAAAPGHQRRVFQAPDGAADPGHA